MRAAIQIAETLRERLQDTDKVSLADTQRNPYTSLQQVLIAQNKPEPALEIAERGRARAFVELLAKRQNRQPENPQPIVKPAAIAEIRQIAQAHSATLVQYSVINNQSLYIWVVQPTGEIAFRSVDLKAILPKGRSLAEYVRAVRSDTIGVRGLRAKAKPNAPGTAQKSDDLKALHQLLIEPIATLLPSDPNQRVIFLPQDSLFLVPFAALQDANGKYLIQQHTILTAPSIQVLQLTQQQQKPGSTTQPALIVGNPTMPSVAIDPGEPVEPLPELPGAEAEARAIAQFLKVPVLTGDQATETKVKQQMSSARLIHLATHGLLDDRRGIGSAIALAPSGTDNGLLTAEEILDSAADCGSGGAECLRHRTRQDHWRWRNWAVAESDFCWRSERASLAVGRTRCADCLPDASVLPKPAKESRQSPGAAASDVDYHAPVACSTGLGCLYTNWGALKRRVEALDEAASIRIGLRLRIGGKRQPQGKLQHCQANLIFGFVDHNQRQQSIL